MCAHVYKIIKIKKIHHQHRHLNRTRKPCYVDTEHKSRSIQALRQSSRWRLKWPVPFNLLATHLSPTPFFVNYSQQWLANKQSLIFSIIPHCFPHLFQFSQGNDIVALNVYVPVLEKKKVEFGELKLYTAFLCWPNKQQFKDSNLASSDVKSHSLFVP